MRTFRSSGTAKGPSATMTQPSRRVARNAIFNLYRIYAMGEASSMVIS